MCVCVSERGGERGREKPGERAHTPTCEMRVCVRARQRERERERESGQRRTHAHLPDVCVCERERETRRGRERVDAHPGGRGLDRREQPGSRL